ncbi:trans-sialidase, putative [Trypanosoma cruzi marinkellei]|uniref:Trans-sialidase, putative n=1 Tax=Trypanosoma cruzi marinkellei TaxID=85056 RepID=K2NPI1_TRYCR|nr:trans-sialidase, putative [Trypanosoma cruzi marinkellei]
MHSRVAAVKAPRTHNRRRVTGSSGRRREGGESERQRPNMSWHVFTSAVLLLLMLMICCGSGGAETAAGQLPVAQFEWKDANGDGEKVNSLGSPGLLKVGNDVFAFAEAQCTKANEGGDSTINGIASEFLTKKAVNAPEEVLNDVKETKVLKKDGSAEARKEVDVSRPTAVVKGNEIYMLVGNYSQTAVAQRSSEADSGILLVKGDVSQESDTEKKIKWENTNDVSRASLAEQLESWTQLIGGGGLGVDMGDGRLLFPVEGTKKIKKESEPEKDEKAVSLIIYTLSSGTTSWTLSKGMSDGGCGHPSVVGWKGKLMMMTACDDGRRRVYEFGDKGESWTEALGTLSRVWGNPTKNEKSFRSGFTTGTFGEENDQKNAMLVTLPVYTDKASTGDNGKGVLHLWLTDNTHIVDIGPVSGEEKEEIAASSLLYKSGGNEELIALYEKRKADEEKPSPGMFSVRLTAQLERVKEVLKTWKEVDVRVSKLCTNSHAPEGASTGTPCSSTFKITDGLVGFLSGNISETTWKDEYLGVNAALYNKEKTTKTVDGVTFTGRGAGAEWPVGKQGENQLYHFANYNFTLVATVSIDGEPKGDTPIPLMGVKLNDEGKSKLMELSYEEEKKWILQCDEKPNSQKLSSNLEPEKAHQVAIVLQNGNQGSAYVDGESVGEATCAVENKGSKSISHFYIGGDGGSAGSQEDVSVTVRNVLLYNRPLSSEEITALNTKLPIQKQKDRNNFV